MKLGTKTLCWMTAAIVAGCGEVKIAQPGPDYGNEEGTVLADAKEDSARYPSSLTAIGSGEVKTASFSATRQFRAFVFEGRAGDLVDAYADGLSGLDTVLYVFKVSRITGRPFGYALASNDDTEQAGWVIRTNTTANPYSSNVLRLRLPEDRRYAAVVTTYRQLYLGRAEVVVKRAPEYQPVALEALLASPTAFQGKKIEVRGEPLAYAICTKRACSMSNPCCNACGAHFGIGTDERRIELYDLRDSEAFSCSGNECTVDTNCRSFPRTSGNGLHTFRGVFEVDELGLMKLSVDSFD